MESLEAIPSAAGQICKISNVLEDENPEDVYIIAEDPSAYEDDAIIYVVNLTDLQRNVLNPEFAPQIAIQKNELIVVAQNIEDYIKNWI